MDLTFLMFLSIARITNIYLGIAYILSQRLYTFIYFVSIKVGIQSTAKDRPSGSAHSDLLRSVPCSSRNSLRNRNILPRMGYPTE